MSQGNTITWYIRFLLIFQEKNFNLNQELNSWWNVCMLQNLPQHQSNHLPPSWTRLAIHLILLTQASINLRWPFPFPPLPLHTSSIAITAITNAALTYSVTATPSSQCICVFYWMIMASVRPKHVIYRVFNFLNVSTTFLETSSLSIGKSYSVFNSIFVINVKSIHFRDNSPLWTLACQSIAGFPSTCPLTEVNNHPASVGVICRPPIESSAIVGFLDGIITTNQHIPKLLPIPQTGQKILLHQGSY